MTTSELQLVTANLVLRPLSSDHAGALFPIFHDAETLTYWYAPPQPTLAATRAYIEQILSNPRSPWWTIFIRGTDQAIGVVGTYVGGAVPGMGYVLNKAYWRRGYGSEAVSAAVGCAFTALHLNRLELWIHEANVASQELARKVGFTRRGQFYRGQTDQLAPHEVWVYGLRASEWAARQPSAPAAAPREIAFTGIHPIITTHDVAATLAFYRDKLGFQIAYTGEGDTPRFAIVTRGEWTSERISLHLVYRARPHAAGELYLTIGGDAQQLYEEFRSRGVTVVEEIAWQEYGNLDFTILDNNGWRLTFSSPA